MEDAAKILEEIALLKESYEKKLAELSKKNAEDALLLEEIKKKNLEATGTSTPDEPTPTTPTRPAVVRGIKPGLEPEKATAFPTKGAGLKIVSPEPKPGTPTSPDTTTAPPDLETGLSKKSKPPAREEYETFKKDFVRIHAEDGLGAIFAKLEQTETFKNPNLSEGRKMLIVQDTLDDIRINMEKALTRAREGKTGWQDKLERNVPILGKVIVSVTKEVHFSLHSHEGRKQLLSHILQDGEKENYFSETGEKYAKMYEDLGLDAVLSSEGKVRIDYAKILENGSSPEAAALNEAGTAFSRIPQTWGIKEQTTKKNYKKWQEAKLALDNAIENMAPVYKARMEKNPSQHGLPPEMAGALEAGNTKRTIELMAQLSKNPDALEELQHVATKTNIEAISRSLGKYLKHNFLTWDKAGSIATGMGVRIAVGTAIGGATFLSLPIATLIAAGVAGGVVGGMFRGGKIAKQKLIEEAKHERSKDIQYYTDKNGVRRQLKKSATAAVMSKIEHRTTQLKLITQDLMNLGASSGSAIEIANKQNQLETHLKYIEEKIQKGEMNYGDEKSQYARSVGLMLVRQEADIAIAMTKEMMKGKPDATWDAYKLASNFGTNIIGWTPLKGRNNSEDGQRQRLLQAIQFSDKEQSVARGIENAQMKAEQVQRFRSFATGAAFGTIGAYVANWFYHTSAGEAVHKVTTAVRTGIKHEAGKIIDTFQNHPSMLDSSSTQSVASPAPNTPTDTVQGTALRTSAPIAPKPVQPEVAPTKPVVIDTKNPLAHVAIKKGEGIGDALLKFRHTDAFKELVKTNPKIAKFFQGNIWEEAKMLHAFRPGNAGGDSLVVGPGSQIGVTESGDIYLTNTASGGHTQILGHIDPATGTFTETTASDDFNYTHKVTHPAHTESIHSDEEVGGPAQNVSPENTNVNPDEIVDVPNTPKINPDEIVQAPADASPKVPLQSNEIADRISNFKRADWIRVDDITDRNIAEDLNEGFGRRNFLGIVTHRGTASPLWRGMASRSAKDIFDQPTNDFTQPVQEFLKHIHALAAKHPEISSSEKFGTYTEKLYEADAEEYVATHPHSTE